MSIQPDHDLLPTLRGMREKLDGDPASRGPSLQELYTLIVRRIAEPEEAQAPAHAGTHHA
ncbi:MAG TPA: hypothetical protein VKX41_16210 [Alloacidobacterium sp.]|nr:hypothetical protein [Alloacidobacterium sp.]